MKLLNPPLVEDVLAKMKQIDRLLSDTKNKRKNAEKARAIAHEVVSGVKVEVVNILSGRPVVIDLDSYGSCCDPSTERYHCM